MKKSVSVLFVSVLLTGALGIGWVSAAPSASHQSSVTLDGKSLRLEGKQVVTNNRVMVPANELAQAIGATTLYDQAANSVTVQKDTNTYRFTPGSKIATINGSSVNMDTPAALVHSVPYVPIRFLAENLGMSVGYDKAANTITLQSAKAPSLRIVSPANGDILHSDQVKVSVAAFQHHLADFREQSQLKTGEGHIHVWLDTDPADPKLAYKMINGEPAVFDKVTPGTHTLTVQLVGNDHKPISPAVKQVIHFQTMAMPGHEAALSHTVDIQSFSFKPGSLTIEAGSTVTFKNLDDVVHTVTAKDGTFDSGPINKGTTYTATFNKPGVYSIYCKPHTFMTGTITVK
ncbi:stalk domain-containing protein [Brevibacillus choshinensis]|nr:stalk domain-containing protein [Brevibacillus choshinensis]